MRRQRLGYKTVYHITSGLPFRFSALGSLQFRELFSQTGGGMELQVENFSIGRPEPSLQCACVRRL